MTLAKGTRVQVRADVKNLYPEDNVEDYAGKSGQITYGPMADGMYQVLLPLGGGFSTFFLPTELEVLDV